MRVKATGARNGHEEAREGTKKDKARIQLTQRRGGAKGEGGVGESGNGMVGADFWTLSVGYVCIQKWSGFVKG